MKISDFIAKHCITMTAYMGVPENQIPEWVKNQPGATAWTCVIRYQRRKLTAPYFQGSARRGQPKIETVLYCLCSGAWRSAVDSSEDFCRDTGWSIDSLQAEKACKSCLRTRKALQRVFGELYSELMQCEED